MANIQVTHDTDPNNARSESSIAINPNPNKGLQIVAASKKFRDIHNYDFTIATEYSPDGGFTWFSSDEVPLMGFTSLADPSLAWNDQNVFLVGVAASAQGGWRVVAYKSTDGKAWTATSPIDSSDGADQPWAAGDFINGRVYIVWVDGSSDLRFAQTKNNGLTWVGAGAGDTPAGTLLANACLAPKVAVGGNGHIYIIWISPGATSDEIKMKVSTDGGDTFHTAISPATDVDTLGRSLPEVHGFPVFPGGKFRFVSTPTVCRFGQTGVAVAWNHFQKGVSRIYYALSPHGGTTWTTGPLLTDAFPVTFQHFHPQIVTDRNGVIGCAFYEFGPKPSANLIDVIMARSFDGGSSFEHFTVTDQPWDPTLHAPWSDHMDQTPIDASVTFIGEYLGLDADSVAFHPIWTDTRTTIQELWTDIVPVTRLLPTKMYEQVAEILVGIIQDGGGIEQIGRHFKRIPPWGPPELDILLGVVCHRVAALVSGDEGMALQNAAMTMVARVAEREIQRLGGIKQ